MSKQNLIGFTLFLFGLAAFGYCLATKTFDRWALSGAFGFAVIGTYCMIPDRVQALCALCEDAYDRWKTGKPPGGPTP